MSYSDRYEEKGVFERLMNRLRRIAPRGQGYAPVMQPALRRTDLPANPSRAVHRGLQTQRSKELRCELWRDRILGTVMKQRQPD